MIESRERRPTLGMKKTNSANQFMRKQNAVNQSQVSANGMLMQKPPLAKKEDKQASTSRQSQQMMAGKSDFIVQNGQLRPRK